ncbi:hypothetical protein PR048_025950 [Dryococelus australis]|uniref:Uncharacterized protein n=1 Tax=Dryococelus australis TaxID=614101 RepID=A0ABQ9GJX9_9NEOP|nr:hypothetical protein PR048_025950 [Dryococelus australis]
MSRTKRPRDRVGVVVKLLASPLRRTGFDSWQGRSRILACGNRLDSSISSNWSAQNAPSPRGRKVVCWDRRITRNEPRGGEGVSIAAPHVPHSRLSSRADQQSSCLRHPRHQRGPPFLRQHHVWSDDFVVRVRLAIPLMSVPFAATSGSNAILDEMVELTRFPSEQHTFEGRFRYYAATTGLQRHDYEAGMKRRGKREIPEKTRRPTAASGTIPTCENPMTRPGIEPCWTWWEASVLIAQPPRPQNMI